jgi:hypothetical protein
MEKRVVVSRGGTSNPGSMASDVRTGVPQMKRRAEFGRTFDRSAADACCAKSFEYGFVDSPGATAGAGAFIEARGGPCAESATPQTKAIAQLVATTCEG